MIFRLQEDMIDDSDRKAMIDFILSKERLTMATVVEEFEQTFAKKLNVPYAMMVNSGSSANLLAMAMITNPKYKGHLEKDSEVLVPSICWSTCVSPILQMGLIPVMVDIDPNNLQIDIDDIEIKITNKTKALFMVHILGICTNMADIQKICNEYNLLLIEDTCESLGAKYKNNYLGTFGKIGTFSFYHSHHITTIEGGMIVCHKKEDIDILRCLRSHGWSREQSNQKELEKKYCDIDPRFLFINVGYNLRPTEIQAVLGLSQLQKLDTFNDNRNTNFNNLSKKIGTNIKPDKYCTPAWFAFPIIVKNMNLEDYKKKLDKYNIEHRPIISGNFTKQPVLSLYNVDTDGIYTGAEEIHESGLYIGLPCRRLWDENELDFLCNVL